MNVQNWILNKLRQDWGWGFDVAGAFIVSAIVAALFTIFVKWLLL